MRQFRMPIREITLSAVTIAVIVWIGSGLQGVVAVQRTGTLADFFTGPPPAVVDSDEVAKARVRLTAGARAHWHSHGWGQLLLPEEGRGRFQIRGEPLRELLPGEPVFTDGGVMHWHGAAPDEPLVMIAVQGGGAEWGEPVSDEVYLAEPSR
ncbi:MAG: cupin [Acidobacteria bacterium]|nr:cupin [Acidobacteriota bacterium]